MDGCIMLLKTAMRPDAWPQPFELKLNWMDKILSSIEAPHSVLTNVCTALEFLTFVTTIVKPDQLVALLQPIQRGLSSCINHQNTRIVRLMHAFLCRLMSIFPPESKHADFEMLYSNVNKIICDNLSSYDKSPLPNQASLFAALMMLKACCLNNSSYVDRLMVPIIRVLNRLTKDHLTLQSSHPAVAPSLEANNSQSELLVQSLDLVRNRIVVMGTDVRKLLIGTILVSLIEKSLDLKIIKCIVRIVDEWIRNKDHTIVHVPSIREKSLLLVKLMQYVEKRFSDESELNILFLEMINYIYRNEYLKQSELSAKLEGAYLIGLRCQYPQIRTKFFETLDASMRRRLHDRLLYIICSQAWDSIGTHYWIKQCIELLILTANTMTQIQNANEMHKIASITSVINLADTQDKSSFVIYTASQADCLEFMQGAEDKEDIFDIETFGEINNSSKADADRIIPSRQTNLAKIIHRQIEFLDTNRNIRTDQLLVATSQLCHIDISLAESIWISIFPRIWGIFDEDQRHTVLRELVPFLSSGSNVTQRDCYPSAINTFVEGLTYCKPTIRLPSNLITYLGKSHNLWHRMTLVLEEKLTSLAEDDTSTEYLEFDFSDGDISIKKSNMFDALSQMYTSIQEEDLWAGLWVKYAQYSETNMAIAYEQMGFFEEAQGAYDLAMTRFKQDLTNLSAPHNINSELMLWENHWIRCAKELNQWDILLDYAQANKEKNMMLLLDSAWRIPDWVLMKNTLVKIEHALSKQYGFKINLYKGFLAILSEDRQLSGVERYVEIASNLCMREWRRLPQIVSHIHLQYLQAAQQIMELHEASQIHQGLMQSRSSSLHDMKAIVKTWRNRLPIIADDLSHWSDIFTWRQHHYQIITQYLERQSDQCNIMLGVHASAQAIIYFGKIARKQNLTGVCQETLSRIYTIPSVPIVDCFQKIRQQVKCYLQMASAGGKNEVNEALEVIESTNLKYFTGEMNAEFYALKGLLLAHIGRSDEAGKAFSAAVQLHDGLAKAWALWGDYMEQLFFRDKHMSLGINALTCFLHACRHQSESRTRKYIAKIIWLVSYDNTSSTLMNTLEKYVIGVPPSYWLPWVPQLLCCLVKYEGSVILNLLSHVGRLYPQAVYFPIRTLYLSLKIEQREKHKSIEQSNKTGCPDISTIQSNSGVATNPIKATPSMWRCSKVMHIQREIHPTILSSLEGIVDQMVWFRESWTEEVLRQLRQGLIKCYDLAFENNTAVNEATVAPHTLHFVKKLGSTFGIGVENIPLTATVSYTSSELLTRRLPVSVQDPVFQKMKEQFANDFDFADPGTMKLHILISKLKTWIKVLETKVKKLPTSFLIEDKCRFLANFNQTTAEVELPGELQIPSSTHYHIRIARFMPRVEIVHKNNTAARRIYIRGTNGRTYPYLVVIDTGLGDARREERVLQLMRMLNYYLDKQKETARRFLNMTVPRLVPISPQMRLAEDNPSSISLREIYKTYCLNMKIDHDLPIIHYYERFSECQNVGTNITHTVVRDIFSDIQTKMVSKFLIKQWAINTFLDATEFWHFRKTLTLQLSLTFLYEHALVLTRLNPDMVYFHKDSGLLNVSFFKFEINNDNDDGESNKLVPFRLTPNIVEFITDIGVSGTLTAAIVSAARSLIQPNYKLSAILKTILQDEVILLHNRQSFPDSKQYNCDVTDEVGKDRRTLEAILTVVDKTVAIIMTRLNSISYFDNIQSKKVLLLIQSATSVDNLCRIDPAWHPWL